MVGRPAAAGVAAVSVTVGAIVGGVLAMRRSLRHRDTVVAELASSRAFLDSVVENLPNMVFVKRAADLRFVRFNKAGEDLIGTTRDHLLGKSDYDLFPEAEADFFTARDREVLAGRVLVDIPSEQLSTANGERILHTRKIPILDEQGRPLFLLGISEDITETHVARLALEQARDEATRANRAKNEFLSRMSHELRTPLNSVIGFAQLLDMDDLNEDQAENVSLILRAGRHLLDLINEVLDVTRIEAGRMKLSLEPVRVADVLRAALDLIRPQAATLGIEVVADTGDGVADDVVVVADQQRLLQVLLNLLSNGVKYNRPGGRVTVSCERSGGTVSLSVTDTGRGIAESDMEQLFVPFERLGAERSDVEGSGVGLTLSRLLTQQMGGSLTVFSELDIGSTFTVELPEGALPDAVPIAFAAAPADGATLPRVVRVLCIEDDVANLRVIERAAEHLGSVEVLTAVQGRLGVELAAEHRPDLILLELVLPDLDGLEVLRRLRAAEVTATIPVVLCTNDAMSAHTDLDQIDAQAILHKPIDLPELFDIIEQVRADGAWGRADTAPPASA